MTESPTRSPWHEKGLTYLSRFLARVGFMFLLMITLPLIATFVVVIISPGLKTGNFREDTFSFILLFGLVTVGIFFIFKLLPKLRAPINFTPSYQPIPPNQLGQPIEVWYEEIDFQRSLKGRGMILFEEKELVLGGNMESALPGGLLLVVDILKHFSTGQKVVGRVSYDSIKHLKVKGRTIQFNAGSDNLFNRFIVSFHILENDGERTYRELKRRFPVAIEYIF